MFVFLLCGWLATGASSGGEAVFHMWIHARQHVDTREKITERRKRRLVTHNDCVSVCVLCHVRCGSASFSPYWTSGAEAAPDKASLRLQDGGMSHMSTCARGRRCWAGSYLNRGSGLLQGQYQHKKKKMQSLEAMPAFLPTEIRLSPRVALCEI